MHTSTTSTVPLEPWTAEQLQQATQGYWLNNRLPTGAIKRILTDSRHAEQGDAFLALKVSVLMRMILLRKWRPMAVKSLLSVIQSMRMFVSWWLQIHV